MSIIVKDDAGKITLLIKGADNVMEERYDMPSIQKLMPLKANLDRLAEQGLKTLLLGSRDLTAAEYQGFKLEYDVCDKSCRSLRMTSIIEKSIWLESKIR